MAIPRRQGVIDLLYPHSTKMKLNHPAMLKQESYQLKGLIDTLRYQLLLVKEV